MPLDTLLIAHDMSPIEQFSTQSYTSSLRPVPHMLAFGKEDAEQEQTSPKVNCKIRIRLL